MRLHCRRGFLLADIMTGMLILSMMTVVLATAVSNQHMGSQRLADSRNAARFAERVLLDLRQGHAPPTAPADMHLVIEPADGGQAIDGFTWTRVTVKCNRQSTTLIGLAKGKTEKQP